VLDRAPVVARREGEAPMLKANAGFGLHCDGKAPLEVQAEVVPAREPSGWKTQGGKSLVASSSGVASTPPLDSLPPPPPPPH
jgi:hypothetical protein